jgi:hypothetical protein
VLERWARPPRAPRLTCWLDTNSWAQEFDLVDERELSPMKELIERIAK